MLGFQKSFLLVRFLNWISCNKGLKAEILWVFLFTPPWDWNILESERLLLSWHDIGQRNTKIYIPGASRMERKHGKCWKLPIFDGKFWRKVFISYISEWNENSMFYNSFLLLVLFTDCLYHFLFWRYLNSSMVSFSSDHLLPFPNSNDLSSCALSVRFFQSVCNVGMVFKVSLHS